ncbi:MAG: hypothetical protein JXX14_16640 [Deltaproteobacteria bacterium]|nr:hypothetical protein [Deltaproteobacteria bacterium]
MHDLFFKSMKIYPVCFFVFLTSGCDAANSNSDSAADDNNWKEEAAAIYPSELPPQVMFHVVNQGTIPVYIDTTLDRFSYFDCDPVDVDDLGWWAEYEPCNLYVDSFGACMTSCHSLLEGDHCMSSCDPTDQLYAIFPGDEFTFSWDGLVYHKIETPSYVCERGYCSAGALPKQKTTTIQVSYFKELATYCGSYNCNINATGEYGESVGDSQYSLSMELDLHNPEPEYWLYITHD